MLCVFEGVVNKITEVINKIRMKDISDEKRRELLEAIKTDSMQSLSRFL